MIAAIITELKNNIVKKTNSWSLVLIFNISIILLKNGYFFIKVGSTKNDKNGKIADKETNSVKELIIVNINK